MTDSRLVLAGIVRRIGSAVVLRGINLEVRGAEVHALVGPIGCGKSTLAELIAGLHRADTGYMMLDGKPYAPNSPAEARRAGTIWIPPRPALIPDLTVAENLLIGAEEAVAGFLRPSDQVVRARGALERLERPDISPASPARYLSPGAMRLIEVGRTLLADARVVVLDEPTSVLDADETRVLWNVVRRLRDRGVAVLLIVRSPDDITAVADRITILKRGVNQGTYARDEWTAEQWTNAIADTPGPPIGKRSSGIRVLPGPATPTPPPAEAPTSVAALSGRDLFADWPSAAALVGVAITLAISLVLRGEVAAFFSGENFRRLLWDTSFVGITALAAQLSLLVGGIDLSIGSVALLAMTAAGATSDPWAARASILVGGAAGLLNGGLVAGRRFHPVTASFATAGVCLGLARALADAVAQELLWPQTTELQAVVCFLVLSGLTVILVQYTILGRNARAIGSDLQRSRLQGIPINTTQVAILTIVGLLAGWAGVMSLGRLTRFDVVGVTGLAFAAAYLGGRGRWLGTLIATGTIGLIVNGCRILGVTPEGIGLTAAVLVILAARGTKQPA